MQVQRQKSRQIRKRIGRNVLATGRRISVVITVHNRGEFIRETLESVIAQKFREHEIIVVNDGSDDTEVLEREMNMRIEDVTYIRQRYAGEGAARNTGIENATGEIMAFLQAGDLWDPELLAKQYVLMQRGSYDVVSCDAALFGDNSPYRRNFSDRHPTLIESDSISLIERRSNVLISGSLVRHSMLLKAGSFETGGLAKPGLHLWVRIAKCGGKFGFQPKQLVKRRVFPGEASDRMTLLENEREVLERLRDTLELDPKELSAVGRRLADVEAEIAIRQGSSFLRSGDHSEALSAFRVASHHQPTLKMKAITWLTRVSPKTALRIVGQDALQNSERPYGSA